MRPYLRSRRTGVAEAEDPAVGADHPVATAIRSGGHAHDRRVQGLLNAFTPRDVPPNGTTESGAGAGASARGKVTVGRLPASAPEETVTTVTSSRKAEAGPGPPAISRD